MKFSSLRLRVWSAWLLGAVVWLCAFSASAQDRPAGEPDDGLSIEIDAAPESTEPADTCEVPYSMWALFFFDLSRCSEEPAQNGVCEVHAHLLKRHEHCAPPLLGGLRSGKAPPRPASLSCGPAPSKSLPPPSLPLADDLAARFSLMLALSPPVLIGEEPLAPALFARPLWRVGQVPEPPPRHV